MKYIIQIFAVIAVIALLTACSSTTKGTDNNTPTGASADASKDVYIDVTDAPTESAPSEDNEKTSADAPSGDTGTPVKSELVGNQWNLSAVYRDGEQQSIGVLYGSVIRETGAYIKFYDDDTFACVLGIPGCQGTYAVENDDIDLHITTRLGAKTEECDEHETVKWDHEAGTLTFDFFGVTNVFAK